MESLADRCEQNARVARRVGLGLTDETELVEIGDGAEFVPAENTDNAQQGQSNTAPSVRNNTGNESRPGQIEYDDFDRGEKIGSGGNADVYKTTLAHRETEQPIAVKEPRMQGTVTAQVVDRFAAEAETWSKLDSHRHILSVLGYGSSPIPWIALEYMNRGDLSNVQSQLNQDQQIRVATQVADGVWHAHQRGIAHLDLKPQNILVESTDGETQPTAKVTDWGLSKMLLDNSASIEGLSPQYSAPEQFDSDSFGKPDNQTDIFQLGTVFYELFTGQHPFQGSTTQAMHGILNDSPATPSDHSPELPDGTDEILLKAISKDKSDRYEAVVNLRDDLNSLN
jgi:serine/threonine protein kinase